jgi:glycosyltransferase involved in cell wall biosynthesis
VPIHVAIDVRHWGDFGIGTHIRNLIRSLARIDTENRYTLIADERVMPELTGLGANFQLILYNRSDRELASNATFPAFLRRLGANLYHIPLNSVPYWMPRPYVVTLHDMSSVLFPQTRSLRSALHEIRFRRGLQRAEWVLAVSGSTKRDVETVLGIPGDKVRLVPNAPDPMFLEAARGLDPATARAVLDRYQVHYPFVLYAGTIRQQKNVPRLVEAFAVLKQELVDYEEYANLRLIVIGDEISRYPQVRRAVQQSRVEQSVRFLGFVPLDVLRVFYKSAAVFAFPSLYEGFGLPPLEAMACGTPVVTSNVSSLPEVVADAAVTVNPENVFDIARGLKDVLTDAALRERLIARGYEQLEQFSWERTARQVLEIYLETAARRQAKVAVRS